MHGARGLAEVKLSPLEEVKFMRSKHAAALLCNYTSLSSLEGTTSINAFIPLEKKGWEFLLLCKTRDSSGWNVVPALRP